jgi:hypothetical protein
MKVYLAARYSRHVEMQAYAADLRAHGHVVTSRWIEGNHDLPMGINQDEAEAIGVRFAQEDWADLMEAGAVINFTEAPGAPGRQRGGRHVEFGIALAMRKRLIIVGPRENVFHHLPGVEVAPNWPAALAMLGRPRPTEVA